MHKLWRIKEYLMFLISLLCIVIHKERSEGLPLIFKIRIKDHLYNNLDYAWGISIIDYNKNICCVSSLTFPPYRQDVSITSKLLGAFLPN